ncbi:polyketide synthase-like protein [Thermothelomyces heterothallicus CBS 202.75]|uniref:polyketide synthase-like protein n=1 Tax=Thermothelomyces heterothallicus CBS 202.75 TaxID=1149848 RepID=UPI0037446B82
MIHPSSHQNRLSAEHVEVLCSAISSETGRKFDVTDVEVPFADLCLDPLAVMNVLETVRERTGIELPASLFRDCSSVAEIANKLGAPTISAPDGSSISPHGGLVQAAFADIGKLLGRVEDEAGTSNFWSDVHPAQMRLVLAYVNESFTRLGSPLSGMAPNAPLSIPAAVLPKHHRVLRGAVFDILEIGGLVERRGDRYVRTSTPVDTTPAEVIYEKLVREHPLHANTHRLLHVTGSRFAECLSGEADPLKLLFGKSKDLLQDFYTNAPMSVVASELLAALLRTVFSRISREQNRAVEILEVGAGLGGTTQFVLDMLAEAGIPFRYVFTDISASFFSAAKARYKDLPPGTIEYLVLDIEKEPPGHLQDRFDAVISTNCIHATKDLIVSCTNARRLLRPAGFFALVEFTTRLYWLDLVFGLLDGWWLFTDDRTHCTTDEAVWKAKLAASGFSDVLWVEGEGGRKPNPQLIIGCTE